MTGDGKINDGTGWVGKLDDAETMVSVLERWVYVHGPEPLAPDIEYTLTGGVK